MLKSLSTRFLNQFPFCLLVKIAFTTQLILTNLLIFQIISICSQACEKKVLVSKNQIHAETAQTKSTKLFIDFIKIPKQQCTIKLFSGYKWLFSWNWRNWFWSSAKIEPYGGFIGIDNSSVMSFYHPQCIVRMNFQRRNHKTGNQVFQRKVKLLPTEDKMCSFTHLIQSFTGKRDSTLGEGRNSVQNCSLLWNWATLKVLILMKDFLTEFNCYELFCVNWYSIYIVLTKFHLSWYGGSNRWSVWRFE